MLTNFTSNKIIKLFPFLLFLINFCFKIPYLTSQDISLDEPFTIYHAQFPVSSIIDQLKNYNNPPLFEIILHFWINAFGISPLSVRLLPLLFACLSPMALYYFAKKNFSLFAAITSSLLLTFSNLLMFYAQDCRVYSLFLLLSILSINFYLKVLTSETKTGKSVFIFILVTTLLLYSHYFGAFILLFQGLHLLLFQAKKLRHFLLYYFIILLLFVPHIYALISRLGDSVSHGTWLKPPVGVESLYNMLWTFSNYPFITVVCIAILILALAKFIWIKPLIKKSGNMFLILSWFLIPFLGMFVISFWVPMYIGRYLIFALPAYYLTLSLCIEELFKKQNMRFIFSGLLVLCFLFTLDYNPDKKQPVSKTISALQEFKTPETLVLVYPKDFLPTFAYTYNRDYFSAIHDAKEYNLIDSLLQTNNIYHVQNSEQVSAILKKSFEDVLFFTQGDQRNSPEDPVFKALSENALYQWKKQVGPNWFLSSYKFSKFK